MSYCFSDYYINSSLFIIVVKFFQNTLIVRIISGTCSTEQLVIAKIRLIGCRSIVFQIYVKAIMFNIHSDLKSLILNNIVILNTFSTSYYLFCVMSVLSIYHSYYNEDMCSTYVSLCQCYLVKRSVGVVSLSGFLVVRSGGVVWVLFILLGMCLFFYFFLYWLCVLIALSICLERC